MKDPPGEGCPFACALLSATAYRYVCVVQMVEFRAYCSDHDAQIQLSSLTFWDWSEKSRRPRLHSPFLKSRVHACSFRHM